MLKIPDDEIGKPPPQQQLPSASARRFCAMTLNRLLLFVLTALALVGAIYFWAIHVVFAALGALVVLVVCLVAALAIKDRLSK